MIFITAPTPEETRISYLPVRFNGYSDDQMHGLRNAADYISAIMYHLDGISVHYRIGTIIRHRRQGLEALTHDQALQIFGPWTPDIVQYVSGNVTLQEPEEEEQETQSYTLTYNPGTNGTVSGGYLRNKLMYALETSSRSSSDIRAHVGWDDTRVGEDMIGQLNRVGIALPAEIANRLGSFLLEYLQPLIEEYGDSMASLHESYNQMQRRRNDERTRRQTAEASLATLEAGDTQRQRTMEAARQFSTADNAEQKLTAFRSLMTIVDEATEEPTTTEESPVGVRGTTEYRVVGNTTTRSF